MFRLRAKLSPGSSNMRTCSQKKLWSGGIFDDDRNIGQESRKMDLEKKLMYQSLKEISDISSAILADTDDSFNGIDVSYLAGVIEGRFDLIKELVGDRYEEN